MVIPIVSGGGFLSLLGVSVSDLDGVSREDVDARYASSSADRGSG